MIELPFDCINVHTLLCHRLPRGSEDSEQDNFPFKSMPALRLAARAKGLPAGVMGSVPSSPGLYLLVWEEPWQGERSDKHQPGQPGRGQKVGWQGGKRGHPTWIGFWSRKQDVMSNSPHDSEGQVALLFCLYK